MKNYLPRALLTLCIVAPLYAGGEKEITYTNGEKETFSLKRFIENNTAKKRAHEQKQRDFQEKTILSSDKTTKDILESYHEKYELEIKKLLQEHNDITQKINDSIQANQQSLLEEEIAQCLVNLSSKKRSEPKRTPNKPTKIDKPRFILIQQPEGVPTCYNPEQPDDLRCLYCLNEVFIKNSL